MEHRAAVKIEDLRGRVIVSCQPVKDGPLDRADFVAGLALAALEGGAAGLRIESLRNVRAVRAATGAPIIGLVKRPLPSSPVFITPEIADAVALADSGADIVAFDATLRERPVPVRDIIAAIHAQGRYAMADISTYDDARAAVGTAPSSAAAISLPVRAPAGRRGCERSSHADNAPAPLSPGIPPIGRARPAPRRSRSAEPHIRKSR